MVAAVSIPGKLERYAAIDEIMDRVTAQYDEKEYADEETKESVMKQVGIILHDLEKNEVRRLITEEKIRPDGRKIDEVRPLNAQVDLLPRVHGSALFTRGETQVLSVCTLGAMGEVQKIESKRKKHSQKNKKLASAIAYIKKPYLCTRITEVTHRMIR